MAMPRPAGRALTAVVLLLLAVIGLRFFSRALIYLGSPVREIKPR